MISERDMREWEDFERGCYLGKPMDDDPEWNRLLATVRMEEGGEVVAEPVEEGENHVDS